MGLWLNIFCGEQTGDILSSVDDFFETLDLAELEIEAGGIDLLISTRLPDSSVNRIAFPLAREMAVWIATLRAGVVQLDETQWYVPEFKT